MSGRRRRASSTPCFRASRGTVSPRLRAVVQSSRPDKQLYRITPAGRAALDRLARDTRAGCGRALLSEALRRRAHDVRRPDRARRAVPSSRRRRASTSCARSSRRTRASGNDFFHYFLLRLGIERAEHSLAWADWVVAELQGESGVRHVLRRSRCWSLGVACTSSAAQPTADPALAADVRKLAAEMERIHPNLFHSRLARRVPARRRRCWSSGCPSSSAISSSSSSCASSR